MLLLGELNIKDTLYSCNRGTNSWADSISSLANLINVRALCKTLEEVGIRGETPSDHQTNTITNLRRRFIEFDL